MLKARTFALAGLTFAFLVMPTHASLNPSEVKQIAEEAYIYGFPMVMNYKVFHDSFLDPIAKGYKGPMNQIHGEARVYTHEDTTVQTPNSDTPYAILGADLRAEPLVLCIPEIDEGRFYNVQMVDMYTHNYGYIGSRTTGNAAACYLIAGPDWEGEKPSGISKVYRCETPFSMIILRTQLFDPSDIENVKKIQEGYKVQSLSDFLDQPAPPAPAEIDWPEAGNDIFSTGFPKMLNFLLQFTPPTGPAEVEKPLREGFAKIGIGPEGEIQPPEFTPEEKKAFGAGIKQGVAKIDQAVAAFGERIDGWQIGAAAGSREFYNGDWLVRAIGSRAGIYGNDAEEATYPFAKSDENGRPLDGSRHNYSMTFPAGQMPPVNAFWSITMYDANTQFLVENPIDRYLINSPMLPDLKKNEDGSLTIYIQHEPPSEERISNWLPAPDGPIFMVMRLYWPKVDPPSVLPPGKGEWSPPGVVPFVHANRKEVKRAGDKSYEMVVRTDERYGHDGLFNGPRGYPYWNYLEYPKPIQNPNLWPDTQSTYFLARLKMPAGASLTLRGTYPRARYLKFALYRWEDNTFVSTGEDLVGKAIEPDEGSINPYIVGANRLGDARDFTLRILAAEAPAKEEDRNPNTMYAGEEGGELQMVIRIYLPDQGMDGTGWGPAAAPFTGRGLPSYEGELADGTKLDSAQVIEQFALPMEGGTSQPLSASQWIALVNSEDNDPALDPATSPAREEPRWEKYWNFKYSILGSFKTAGEQSQIPYLGAMDGGGDPETQYFYTHISRKFGPVYVVRGKMPTFPDTYSGSGGKGLEIMPEAQTQYWSLVSCEAVPSGQIVDGLTDMQVPLDSDRNYTIVASSKEDRPKNATLENGIAWLEWSPRGEGMKDPRNRTDFGMLMIRIMATNPSWDERPDKVTGPGMEEEVMGPYLPRGEYTDKATFEANGTN